MRAPGDEGWRPLDDSLLHCCLPAVWPSGHRCWVPDRLPRVSRVSDGSRSWVEPWDEDARRSVAEHVAEEAAACGLPEPPPGRLWLLRSPWPSLGVRVVLRLLIQRCEERDLPVMTTGVTEAARDLLTWPEELVWEWWDGPQADAARAWRARGRVGEDAAALVLDALGPSQIAALTSALSEEQAVAWCRAVGATGDAAVARIRAWLDVGLPADPPDDRGRVLAVATPEEAERWFAEGFDLDDMALLGALSPAAAADWREFGFGTSEIGRLLEADPLLTPDEARAFDAAGIGPAERLRWVEDGFAAAAARAWTDLGVLPGEARVWRSVWVGPEDARARLGAGGGFLPDEAGRVGWVALGGHGRAERRYGVTDPPGTRGRTAARGGRPFRRP